MQLLEINCKNEKTSKKLRKSYINPKYNII